MWKAILNTQLGVKGLTSEKAASIARELGYPMFVWNWEVYRTPNMGEQPLSQPLGIKTPGAEDPTI
jgi:hypothetical protein